LKNNQLQHVDIVGGRTTLQFFEGIVHTLAVAETGHFRQSFDGKGLLLVGF
jgi:hypothetical protein